MKKGTVVLIVVVLAAGLVGYWMYSRAGSDDGEQEQETVKVKRGPIRKSVSSTGRGVANLDVEIKCKASGEVAEVPRDVSDRVKKGDLLLRLDPADEERNVRGAEVSLAASEARFLQAERSLLIAERNLAADRKRAAARLASAKARAKDAQAKAERQRRLLEKKLVSQEECGTAETGAIQAAADLKEVEIGIEELETDELALELKRQDVRLARAQVELDRIALSDANERLKDTRVLAPIDGVVSSRDVQTGQIISSGVSNVGGGTAVMTISDLSRLFVIASVDESEIGGVETGQDVTVTADAYPEARFRGSVVRIATKGVDTSNVVTFEVKIEVLGRRKGLLRPEMTANVEILISERESALLVPADSVFRRKGKRMIRVAKGEDSFEEREVEVGISDGISTEIVSGLKEGEAVVVSQSGGDSRWSGGRPPSIRRMGRAMSGGGRRR